MNFVVDLSIRGLATKITNFESFCRYTRKSDAHSVFDPVEEPELPVKEKYNLRTEIYFFFPYLSFGIETGCLCGRRQLVTWVETKFNSSVCSVKRGKDFLRICVSFSLLPLHCHLRRCFYVCPCSSNHPVRRPSIKRENRMSLVPTDR